MRTKASNKKPLLKIENITSILSVKDLEKSKAFYIGILDFKEAAWGDESFTSVSKDGVGIYLCKNQMGNSGTWLWIGVEGDLFALYDELVKKGVRIRQAPQNYSWALEMQVEDPDGHVLRLGAEPDTTIPFVDHEEEN